MIGAIIGDVIGSVFEIESTKTEDFKLFNRFSRFTDDTVLTIAIANSVLNRTQQPVPWLRSYQNANLYARSLKEYARRFPNAGYGELFIRWSGRSTLRGYRSFGNGSAMRVSSIGFAFDTLNDVLNEARLSAIVTHNHPEGIKGAQAIASAIFLARKGKDKPAIRTFLEQRFGYDLSQTLGKIRPSYTFDSSCQGSVPQAIIAFMESADFEDAIRKAISLGGDSDTLACMAGGIAQAYYKTIPTTLITETKLRLDHSLRQVIDSFNTRYGIKL